MPTIFHTSMVAFWFSRSFASLHYNSAICVHRVHTKVENITAFENFPRNIQVVGNTGLLQVENLDV